MAKKNKPQSNFNLHAKYQPTGDQPTAIKNLVSGVNAGMEHQTLLGVTGSGKTFSVANVIEQVNKPTLIISHNKTLAAQLYQEYKEFFPKNAVEYFVSYYDYYQPEAYIPQTDTYIEKDADINEDIDKLRLSTTTSLMTRNDVIVVASVSAIYNLGSPEEYLHTTLPLKEGMPIRYQDLLIRLTQLFYNRSDYEFKRGTFRVSGDTVDVFPAYLDIAVRIEILDDKLTSIKFIEPITGKVLDQDSLSKKTMGSHTKEFTQDEFYRSGITGTLWKESQNNLRSFTLYPAKHYVTNEKKRETGIEQIRKDLVDRVGELKKKGKEIEAYRLEQKTNYDLEILQEIGYCKGIENYSRYFDGRKPGEAPSSLLNFFPKDYLTIIDESHITVPQVRGMYNGDQSRKQTLIEYGFRLPSALDNRPLQFDEFIEKSNQIIYTTATPNDWEQQQSLLSYKSIQKTARQLPDLPQIDLAGYPKTGIVEQIIRPTGLLDPEIQIRSTKGQIDNLLQEILKRVKKEQRVLVTTLTKRMSEDLSQYLLEQDIKVHYLHSDIDTLERVDILDNLRRGKYDVLVGINLLREGLDLPEVTLVAILDADKEGFLRSETSLVQTMGRAARHSEGRVIMYADKVTGSMQRAIDEVTRRRKIQIEHNEKHGITPTTINKPIREKLIERTKKPKNYEKIKLDMDDFVIEDNDPGKRTVKQNRTEVLKKLEIEMKRAASELEFEKAAILRDRIDELKKDL